MSNSDAERRADVARTAAAARWQKAGNPVVVRSALTVIERADELPESLREQLHEVTEARDE